MENILIEMIDVKKFLEIANIFEKRINIENDEEIIENLKDEWFGNYWDILYEAISSLDNKSVKTFNTKEGDIINDFISKLNGPPFRQHEFNKIVNKAFDDYYKKIENCKDKDYDPKIDFYAPKIDFFIKNNGERGFEIQEEKYPDYLNDILNNITAKDVKEASELYQNYYENNTMKNLEDILKEMEQDCENDIYVTKDDCDYEELLNWYKAQINEEDLENDLDDYDDSEE